MLEFAVPLAIFFLAALQDGTKQRVSNLILAMEWISLGVFFPSGMAAAGFAFGFLFLLNEASFHFKRQIFGWADVLMLPPLYGILTILGQPWLVFVAPGGMFFAVWEKKKPAALAPFCLLALVFGIIFHLFPFVYAAMLDF